MQSKLWFEQALLPTGWARCVSVQVADGQIVSVETDTNRGAAEAHRIAIPGLCNVHSHTFQRGMAGLAEARGPTDDDFWTWREWMYKFLDHLTPEDIEAIAAQAFMEMLESGFTRVGEFHYLHHAPDGSPYDNLAELAERICAASAEIGIGLTLLPVYYAQGGFAGAKPAQVQRRFLNDVDRFEALLATSRLATLHLDDAVLGVAPHSLRAVSDRDLARLVADHPGERFHIHVAEQHKEVADCLAWSGRRPIEWLFENCDVNHNWCLIHATHVTDSELGEIARSGAVVGLCPLTEANLGDGVFPARSFQIAGGSFGIGTDSNIQIDVASELRAMEYAQRLEHRSRNVLTSSSIRSTGGALFRGAVAGGAQAIGGTRGLAVGESADIVTFDLGSATFSLGEGDQVLDSWIFAGRRREIDCVWRRGSKIVSAGAHRNRVRVEKRFRSSLTRLTSE